MQNPLLPFLQRDGLLIVDGGLATELEKRGYDLQDLLWSARLLRDDPEAIRQVHLDYLRAGADVIISASYQATVPAFVGQGMAEAEATALIQRSVQLSCSARDQFWAEEKGHGNRLRPLVAASVGPYGAYLADGSEYTGNYDLNEDELLSFHRDRWHLLADSGPDLLACETIPSAVEARALTRLLPETEGMPAWFSFSCRNGVEISDGTALREVLSPLNDQSQVVAVGINCTAPRFLPSLIERAQEVTTKPIIAYPNSGETYNSAHHSWSGQSDPAAFGRQSREWHEHGACLIGGCCRTGPDHIRQIREALRG